MERAKRGVEAIKFTNNPFMREAMECFDNVSLVREVIVKKGCSVGWSTCLTDEEIKKCLR